MKIYGHRGASDQYPENTMLAFKKAIEKGANGIEADVHMTKDGQCVLIHDETIDRTSDGIGWVKDYTYEELLKFEFKNGKDVNDWVKIPKLAQLLGLAKDAKIDLILDIKTDFIDYKGIEQKIYALVKEYDLLERVIFSSANIETLLALKQMDSNVKTGFVFERNFEDQAIKARHYKMDYLHPRYSMLTDRIIKNSKNNGFVLNVWTPNREENIQMVKDYDVNICITNKVTLAKQVENKEKV